MHKLASAIKKQLDELARGYAQRLSSISDYTALAEAERLELARAAFRAVVDSLEQGDERLFVEFAQAHVQGRLDHDLDVESFAHALFALEEVLIPLIDDLETTKFVWRLVSRAKMVVTEHAEAPRSVVRSESSLLDNVSMLSGLQGSRQMLRLIMDHIPQSVFWKDKELNYLGCNRVFAQGKGLTPEEVVGKTDYDLSPKAQAERFRADDRQVLESGQPKLDYEEQLLMPDGKRRWLRTSKIPLKNADDQVVAILAMYEDITARKEFEIELQRLARAVDATRDAIMITAVNGDVLFVNPAFEQVTGYSVQEAVGENPRLLKSGVQDEADYARMWRTITAGQTWEGEVVNRRKDGTLYHAQLSISPVLDDAGHIEQFIAIQRDVSEQKQTEQAWQASQRMLRLVIDTIPDMMFWKDRDLVYLGCNTRFAQASGLDAPESVVGKTDYDLGWDRSAADVFRATDRQVIETATPQFHVVQSRRREDGTQAWMDTTRVPLFDDEGDVTGVLGIVRDISERKQAEEAVRESEQLLQGFIDNANAVAYVKDAEGRYILVNRQYEILFHVTKEGIIGKTDYDVFPPELAAVFRKTDLQVLDAGVPVAMEEVAPHEDGLHTYLSNKFPLVDSSGQIYAIAGISTDVTEFKRVEEEQKRLLAQVQESQILLRMVIDSTNDWIFAKDRDLRYILVNNGIIAKYMGLTPDDFVGKDDYEMGFPVEQIEGNPEKGISGYRNDDLKVLAGETLRNPYVPVQMSKDETVILETVKSPLRNAQGEIVGVLGFSRDITERIRFTEEREQLIERRAQQARVSAQVSQELAGVPQLDELFRRVVTLAKEQLGYYHAQIFRYDVAQERMVVATGYGEAGARMVAAGHGLAMGSGVVGAAAATGESVLVSNVREHPDWRPNPDLPDTQGELAVPIVLRGEVLGVLDVQSDRAGALTDDDRLLLESISGPIAVAMEAGRLLEEAQTFRLLVENAGQGIGMGTLDGQAFYGNPALLEMLGEPNINSFVGNPFVKYYPRHEQQRLQSEILPAVMAEGRWQGEVMLRARTGRVTPTLHNLFLLQDQADQPRYIVNIVTDITESRRTQAEIQERLQELNSLYRTISAEGWGAFRDLAALPGGYFYDGVEAKRKDDLWLPEIGEAASTGSLVVTTQEQPVVVAPLSVPGGEVVGALGLYDDPEYPLSAEELALVEQLADQVAQALEGARLSQETRDMLSQIQMLYDVSRALGVARDENELLQAVVRPVADTGVARVDLMYVDLDAQGRPEWAEIVATWQRDGDSVFPAGTRYHLPDFALSRLWVASPEQAMFIADTAADERIGKNVQKVLARMNCRAMVIVPLARGGRWVGLVRFTWTVPRQFGRREKEIYDALIGLASTAVESRRLLVQARANAQREQQLRQMAGRLRTPPDVDGVLRALARELGQVLGRRTFVSVGDVSQLTQSIEARSRVQAAEAKDAEEA